MIKLKELEQEIRETVKESGNVCSGDEAGRGDISDMGFQAVHLLKKRKQWLKKTARKWVGFNSICRRNVQTILELTRIFNLIAQNDKESVQFVHFCLISGQL
ncbi:uncharacterized protein LOC118761112 [Octopus sinensis]|uniref:Uncharacterized protein LOC118761112 n=1 Tax=Octopus sinensis TaxID=2607531 RepID=A0A7E6EGI4_9MOLL|nr:uncharacterized protein LOC118761112 [Octopus sinensis]